jgi:glutaminase
VDLPSIAEQTERPYVSTGHLPEAETVQKLVSDAHRRFKSNTDGQNSHVYPALARVPNDLFGICVVGTSEHVCAAGDVEHEEARRALEHGSAAACIEDWTAADGRSRIAGGDTGRAASELSTGGNSKR